MVWWNGNENGREVNLRKAMEFLGENEIDEGGMRV